ncbi:hypothetical protein D3C81_2100840 [compost metagenome]
MLRQRGDLEAGDGTVDIRAAEADGDQVVFVAGGGGCIGLRCIVDRRDGDGAGGRGAVFQALVIH